MTYYFVLGTENILLNYVTIGINDQTLLEWKQRLICTFSAQKREMKV